MTTNTLKPCYQYLVLMQRRKETRYVVTSALPSPKMHPRMGMEKRVITMSNPKKHAEKI